MKKYIITLTVFLIGTWCVTTNAQQKFEFAVGGGIDSPIGPKEFSDGYNLGYTAKAAVGYFLSPKLNVGLNLSYNRFGLDENGFVSEEFPDLEFDISGGNLTALELAGVGKYYFKQNAPRINFYIMGGPGVAFSSISDFKITALGESETLEGESETNFMLTGGIGLTYQVAPNWKLFVEGRYSHIFTSEDNLSYMPTRVGIIF